MRRRPFALALVGWTFFVWTTRIANIWRDDALDDVEVRRRLEEASLLDEIGLEFDEAMLSWPPGPVPEDGNWAPYWYDSVHRSTGFGQYRPKDEAVPDRVAPVMAAAVPLYERLLAYAITG